MWQVFDRAIFTVESKQLVLTRIDYAYILGMC